RVGDGRPGGDLVPRARGPAADRGLGRDGLHGRSRCPAGLPPGVAVRRPVHRAGRRCRQPARRAHGRARREEAVVNGTENLAYLSASDALARFRSRELSPVELVEGVIARADEVEGTVNPFPQTYFDEAVAAAREAEARYAGRGEAPRAPAGVPGARKGGGAVT